MLGGVTRHMLPHLTGVPHLHVNRPLICEAFFLIPKIAQDVNKRSINVFGSPFSSICRVSTVSPTVFSYNWVAFLKSSSWFDFDQWKKRSQRKTEIFIDGRSIFHSWQSFQLAFLVTWIVTFSAQSEQVSTNTPFFLSALKDYMLDDIQTINLLPFRLYHIILFRSRSPKRRHQY